MEGKNLDLMLTDQDCFQECDREDILEALREFLSVIFLVMILLMLDLDFVLPIWRDWDMSIQFCNSIVLYN